MKTMINIADLKDPNDSEGRSYREVNNATEHSIEIDTLVEMTGGSRLYVTEHRRDCDGTPLYCLGFDGDSLLYNYSIDCLSVVKAK